MGESRGASQKCLHVRNRSNRFAGRREISLRTREHKENARTKKWKVMESLMLSLITEGTNPEVAGLLFT